MLSGLLCQKGHSFVLALTTPSHCEVEASELIRSSILKVSGSDFINQTLVLVPSALRCAETEAAEGFFLESLTLSSFDSLLVSDSGKASSDSLLASDMGKVSSDSLLAFDLGKVSFDSLLAFALGKVSFDSLLAFALGKVSFGSLLAFDLGKVSFFDPLTFARLAVAVPTEACQRRIRGLA